MNLLPKLLLFYWNDEDYQIPKDLFLQAEILLTPPNAIPKGIQMLHDHQVVGCIFLLSEDTFKAPTFGQLLAACNQELSRRKDFRIFVDHAGIEREKLNEIAKSTPSAADLLDTVHIGEETSDKYGEALAENVKQYLRQLPAILDYEKYEGYQQWAFRLIPALNLLFLVALATGWWLLGMKPEETLESEHLAWIVCTIGVVFYFSFLSLFSFGNTRQKGRLLRMGMLFFPLFVLRIIPFIKLREYWLFLLAGFCLGFLLDTFRRMWTQKNRKQIRLSLSEKEGGTSKVNFAGQWNWKMLTTAPVLGAEPNVFISYARGSSWGRATATELHASLKDLGIPSFLDVEGIIAGTSWRHKLQEAVAKATIFISVQDTLTASRYWPSAELNAAIQSQIYCGAPTIIVLHDHTLDEKTSSGLLAELLARAEETDPAFFRTILCKDNTVKKLTNNLKSFRSIGVMSPAFGFIFSLLVGLIRMLLARLVVFGTIAVFFIGMVWGALSLFGVELDSALQHSGWRVFLFLLFSFLLGATIRLAFASRFEVQMKEATPNFWLQIVISLILCAMLNSLIIGQAPIGLVFAFICFCFGFLSANDFISTALPGSGKYRKPPE